MKPTNEPAKKYTPNMVEYQCGVSDMIQSTDAKVWVSARMMIEGPAKRRKRADTPGSPVASCPREPR